MKFMRNSQHKYEHERLPHHYDKPFLLHKICVQKIKLQNQLSAWLTLFTSFIIPFFQHHKDLSFKTLKLKQRVYVNKNIDPMVKLYENKVALYLS